MKLLTRNYLPLLMLIIGFWGCMEDAAINPTNSAFTKIRINLTDAPGDYDEVNIDLQTIRVQLSDSSWVDFNTNSGIYDLLKLQNGIDTTIVNDSLSQGTQITQLRMILGDSNTVMIDSIYYPLKVPSGSTSGFKIKFQNTLAGDSLGILLDFDADKSIVKRGSKNEYLLQPVLKAL
jgi:hypothetical protein